jgi:hypothetical protein
MATYEQTAAHYSRQHEQQLRQCLRNEFGARHYRIMGDRWHDEVQAYGRMPNSIETGWYRLGDVRSVSRNYNL